MGSKGMCIGSRVSRDSGKESGNGYNYNIIG